MERGDFRSDARAAQPNAEVREFMIVVHRALRMICAYIERRYMT